MIFNNNILMLVNSVLAQCQSRGLKIVTAESCTAGLLASAITSTPGSSSVLERGWIVYSNESKIAMLGVSSDLISRHGAVSENVAHAMAEGALKMSIPNAQIGVAITGIAGPVMEHLCKPVGLVHFAVAMEGSKTLHRRKIFGNIGREAVRLASVEVALKTMLGMVLN